jgi:transcriptional regulator with XRE-family HTH domain
MTTEGAPFIFEWHGSEANALRMALRMTQDQIAEQLGCAQRTVARWGERPASRLSNVLQDALDTLYGRLTEMQVRRFLHALQTTKPREVSSPVVMAAEMTLMQARINELEARLTNPKEKSEC